LTIPKQHWHISLKEHITGLSAMDLDAVKINML